MPTKPTSTRTAHKTRINKWYARNTYIALWMVGLRMVSNCFKYLITHTWEWGVKIHQNQSPFYLKTILRVLFRVKQTIACIKILIGIGKQGRRTVDNQSRSVLQPFYYVVIKTMALMTFAKSTNTPCDQAWHVYWSLFTAYRRSWWSITVVRSVAHRFMILLILISILMI